MASRYYICNHVENGYNAGSKAVNDVNSILQRCGFQPLYFGFKIGCNKMIKLLSGIRQLLNILFTIRLHDLVFIQYPIYINKPLKELLYRILLCKRTKIILLVHDLPTYRGDINDDQEEFILFKSDVVICHTPNMKEYLLEKGVIEDRIRILYLFDYLTNEVNLYQSTYSNKIIYAGNLVKSEFVPQLAELDKLQFLLYGLPEVEFKDDSKVKYMGKFSPSDISGIIGDWGLVWDGPSLLSCEGRFGEYLRINSPHKVSLYIASEKPVIIWENSSLKDFIVNNHLGISVKSLTDIDDRINALSNLEIANMQKAIKKYSIMLRHGEILEGVINSIV